jgi:hypothetical protein
MLSDQCLYDVVDRMTIPNLYKLKRHISNRIDFIKQKWEQDMTAEGIERGLGNTIYIRINDHGFEVRWQKAMYIDISRYDGLAESGYFGLARYIGYDHDLTRSEVHVNDIINNYRQYQLVHNKETNELTMKYLQFVIDVWKSYNETCKEY